MINHIFFLKKGKITKEFDGTTIRLKIGLHPFIGVSMTVWLSGAFLAVAGILIYGLIHSKIILVGNCTLWNVLLCIRYDDVFL